MAVPEEEVYFSRKEEIDEIFERKHMPDYSKLPDAPEGEPWVPERGHWPAGFKVYDFPKVPKISWIVGPSAIMLGASLGSGESLFWPNITAMYGWAMWWGFWVGAITQWIINTELMRWTVATGETWFRQMARLHPIWPWVFFIFGFIHLVWPGWVSGSAKFAGYIVGGLSYEWASAHWPAVGAALMFLIWVISVVGPWIYRAIELAEIVLVILAYALMVILLIGIVAAGKGGLGFGHWYDQFANIGRIRWDLILAGKTGAEAEAARSKFLLSYLGGLAYAGAGGYINLSESLWVREKGYGMAAWHGRIKNPIFILWGREKPEEIPDFGIIAKPEKVNLARWKAWWYVTNMEHFILFALTLIAGAFIMSGMARAYAAGTEKGAIDMWLQEVLPRMGADIGNWSQYAFGVMEWAVLFTTQLGIVDVFVRNSTDVVFDMIGKRRGWRIDWIYFWLLTIFVAWGIGIILAQVKKPWILLVIGANIAGIMMWPYSLTTVVANTKMLPKYYQPSWLKILGMWWATGFYGYFSVLVIIDNIQKNILHRELGTGGKAVLWAIYIISLVIMIVMSSYYHMKKMKE